MNFISTSQDIFFLVLAFCILWLTAFFAWLMYYAIRSVKQVYETISSIKEKIDAVDTVIKLIKDKLNSSASYLTMIVGGITKIIGLLGTGEDKKKKRTKRS